MWRGLIVGAFLVGGLQEAHAQDSLVSAFQSVCIDARASFAGSAAASESLGWTRVGEDVRPELTRVFSMARRADTAATPIRQLQAYQHDQQSGTFLVLSELTIQGRLVNGCYLYDFEATEPLAPEIFVNVVGSQPNEAVNQPGLIISQKWVGPASLPGVATLRVGFIPVGSEPVEASGFSGLALAITSLSTTR